MKHWTITLLIVAVACGCTGSVSAAERPNILLIVSEDNGPELGCYGDPFVKTPVLDRLAEEGVRFHNAYVPQAGCSQSRAALLTGLYPHQNGQIGLATWKFRMYRENTPNLVRSLREAGYRTVPTFALVSDACRIRPTLPDCSTACPNRGKGILGIVSWTVN